MRNKLVKSSELVVGSVVGSNEETTNYERITNNQIGQSLIEVLVASAVGVLVVTALTFATIFSLRNAGFAKNSAQATKLAQEGIERVRTGRDRNAEVNITGTKDCPTVAFWNGNSAGVSSLWACKLYASYGSGGSAYFKFDPSSVYDLNFLSTSADIPNSPEDPLGDGKFKRVVILSDDAGTYSTQKTITVIVRWADVAGNHDSKLTTILRKL